MKRTFVFVAVLALLGGSGATASADTGQAFDQITKFAPNGDVATLEPGDFSADWQAASAPAAHSKGGGGMLGMMRNAMNGAQGAMAMMQSGLAESRYVAGSKERIDTPAQQTATITDCGARTVTHLDLKAKTYYVISLDQPRPPAASGGGRPAPAAAPTDDGSKTSMTIVNAALGPKTVFGNNASGFTSDITMVTTKANGDTSTAKIDRKLYASSSRQLTLSCPLPGQNGPGMMSSVNRYEEIQRLMAARKDPRFTVSSSGPALPGTLGYFEALQFGGGDGGANAEGGGHQGRGKAVVVIERDNIRSIDSGDPVFSVPADFTKVDAP